MVTDSLLTGFETDNFDTDLENFLERYDSFNFINLENHPEIYDETNKKFPGELKVETPDSLDIGECAALRSKSYAYTHNNEKESKTENYKDSI